MCAGGRDAPAEVFMLQPGDVVFISGIPGEAAAGLATIQRSMPQSTDREYLQQRFLHPTPRVQLGRAIRMFASAAIDVSDGLVADLGHICTMSRCAAHIDMESLPASMHMHELFAAEECDRFALSGGDDYELLFTVSSENILALQAAIASGVRCTPIGRITQGHADDMRVTCYRAGKPLTFKHGGYDHFV